MPNWRRPGPIGSDTSENAALLLRAVTAEEALACLRARPPLRLKMNVLQTGSPSTPVVQPCSRRSFGSTVLPQIFMLASAASLHQKENGSGPSYHKRVFPSMAVLMT